MFALPWTCQGDCLLLIKHVIEAKIHEGLEAHNCVILVVGIKMGDNLDSEDNNYICIVIPSKFRPDYH